MLSSRDAPVMTGHADGLITLDLAEAGDAHRERMREEMGEPYRTVLGHLRHEVGHYYWPVLSPDAATQERARALFGDEREDYQAALDRHYENGAPPDWGERFVSAYATMHPWRTGRRRSPTTSTSATRCRRRASSASGDARHGRRHAPRCSRRGCR